MVFQGIYLYCRVKLLFCQVCACFWQKLTIRHVFQGTSFDELTQDNINLMMSHINALKRPKFKASPYELTVNLLGEEIIKNLGVEFVNPNDITFSPKFFK